MKRCFSVNSVDDIGFRIDAWLASQAQDGGECGLSRSFLQRQFDKGFVTVCGKQVKPSYKTRMGDFVEIEIPEPEPLMALPEDISLDVLYEDNQLIVVNKPKGMVVHPAPGHARGTLVNALLYRCGDLSGINGVIRPGIVHRIDRDTSGLLVAAKTDEAHRSLTAQLSARTVTRKYLAIACGRIDAPVTIDAPIARNESQRKKMAVDSQGRRAVTHITPLYPLEKIGVHTYLEARLETGRTHQIRVHLAHINRPVLGDPLYGGSRRGLHTDGQALHAASLGFLHPSTGEYMEFNTLPPPCFLHLLSNL